MSWMRQNEEKEASVIQVIDKLKDYEKRRFRFPHQLTKGVVGAK